MIDAHQHVFWHGRDDAGLIADMDAHGIQRAWLLSWEIPPSEDAVSYHGILNPAHIRADGTHAGIPLSDLILARNRFPDRFVLGYCPHPLRGDAPSLFEAAYRVHGVRVCGEWKFRMLINDPRCLNLFRKAGDLRCPVVLHLDVPYMFDPQTDRFRYVPEWYGGTVEHLEDALKQCPETVFIGHAPGFWREISGGAERDPNPYPEGPIQPGGRIAAMLEAYPNLYADLSAGSGLNALRRDLAHARDFTVRYADRLLFGRDSYGPAWNELLKELDLPAAVYEQIVHGNASRLLTASN